MMVLWCVILFIVLLFLFFFIYIIKSFSKKKNIKVYPESLNVLDQANYLASVRGTYEERVSVFRKALADLVAKYSKQRYCSAIEELVNDHYITEDHLVSLCEIHELGYSKHDEPDGKPSTFHVFTNEKFDFEDEEVEV